MSKYTTEVRFILETAAGYMESQGLGKIDEIINASWDTVFQNPTTDSLAPVIGSIAYTERICKLILRHYYTREIAAETAGLWRKWMQDVMREISTYYNKLYESTGALSLEKALTDVDVTYTHEGSETRNNDSENESQIRDTGTVQDNGSMHDTNRYSDTPQGGLTGIEQNRYLTEVNIEDKTDNNTRTNNLTRNITGNETNSGETNDEYTNRIFGKHGGKSYSELLMEYRKTLLRLDEMIIDEFAECFFNLW